MKHINKAIHMLVSFYASNCLASAIQCPAIINCDGNDLSSCVINHDLFPNVFTQGTYHKGFYTFRAVEVSEGFDQQSKIACQYKNAETTLLISSNQILKIDYSFLRRNQIWYWQIDRGGFNAGFCYDSPKACEIKTA